MPAKPTREKEFLPARTAIKTITARVDKLLSALVYDAMTLPQAAEAAGYQQRHALQALNSPVVRKEYQKRIDEVRTGLRARNIHAAAAIRDVVFGAEGFTAAEGTAALKAAAFIEGNVEEQRQSSVQMPNPGYVIVLPASIAQPQLLGRQAVIEHKPLIINDRFTDGDQ